MTDNSSRACRVTGVGESIVDVIAECDDSALAELGLAKGTTHLVGMERRAELLERFGEGGTLSAGGSVANTMRTLGMLGLRATLAGKARDDGHGRFFAQSMADAGVGFPNPLMAEGDPTSVCVVLVTPDGERTMNTNINPSSVMDPVSARPDLIGGSDIAFIEGYMAESAPEAVDAAINAAKGKARAGMSLADAECVGRNLDAFRGFAARLDFCIGNEAEWRRLLGAGDGTGIEGALEEWMRDGASCPIAACTLSGKGAVAAARQRGNSFVIARASGPEWPKPLDTTGAGDQFAAGFIHGLAKGWGVGRMAEAGNMLAGRVLDRRGAHLERADADWFIHEWVMEDLRTGRRDGGV